MRVWIIFWVLAFAIGGIAQTDTPTAKLIDEFGKEACDPMLARVDGATIALNQESTSQLLVNISSSSEEYGLTYKQLLRNALVRRSDISRTIFSKGPQSASFRVQFWLIPAGAQLPANAKPWPERKIDFSRPYHFADDPGDGICPSFVPDEFASLIKAHPMSDGKVVLYSSSREVLIENAAWFRKTLTMTYSIPRDHLRIVVRKTSGEDAAEFWIVPRRTKLAR